MHFVLLTLAILAEVIATSFLKETEGFTKLWPSVVVSFGYALAFYFLSLTLKTIPVGIVYAIWSGAGIVLVSLIAYFFYDQKLDSAALIGIGFIVVGVIIVNVFSKSIEH